MRYCLPIPFVYMFTVQCPSVIVSSSPLATLYICRLFPVLIFMSSIPFLDLLHPSVSIDTSSPDSYPLSFIFIQGDRNTSLSFFRSHPRVETCYPSHQQFSPTTSEYFTEQVEMRLTLLLGNLSRIRLNAKVS